MSKNLLLSVSGIAVLATSLGITPTVASAKHADPPDDVNVVNTAPIAVAGSVTVANAVAVGSLPPVTLAAGAKLAIDPSANTVTLGNAAGAPLLVREVTETLPRVRIATTVRGFQNQQTVLVVPAGSRFVLDHVDVLANIHKNTRPLLSLVSTLTETHTHFLLATYQQSTANGFVDFYAAESSMKLVFEPGETVTAAVQIDGVDLTPIQNAVVPACFFEVEGHFVPAQ